MYTIGWYRFCLNKIPWLNNNYNNLRCCITCSSCTTSEWRRQLFSSRVSFVATTPRSASREAERRQPSFRIATAPTRNTNGTRRVEMQPSSSSKDSGQSVCALPTFGVVQSETCSVLFVYRSICDGWRNIFVSNDTAADFYKALYKCRYTCYVMACLISKHVCRGNILNLYCNRNCKAYLCRATWGKLIRGDPDLTTWDYDVSIGCA